MADYYPVKGLQVTWLEDGGVRVEAGGKSIRLTREEFDSKSEAEVKGALESMPEAESLFGLVVFADKAHDEGFISKSELEMFKRVMKHFAKHEMAFKFGKEKDIK